MKYLVISDLHLGAGDHADLFLTDDDGKHVHRDRDDQLLAWLDSVKYDKLIVNGDAYELWQNKMRHIKKAHPKLVERFNDAIILIGNHDYRIFGKSEFEIELSNTKKVLVTHGFQNDPSMTSPWTRVGNWCLGQIQKYIPGSFIWLEDKFSVFDKKLINKAYEYADLKLRTYDFVVFGHTHVFEVLYYNDRKGYYFNSGSCRFGKFMGVVIDTEKSSVSLIEGKQ